MNTLNVGDRVIVNNVEHFLNGELGLVVRNFDISTEVKLDIGTTIITAFNKLTKVETPKKEKKK